MSYSSLFHGPSAQGGQADLLARPDLAQVVDRLDRLPEVVDLAVGETAPLEQVGQGRARGDEDLFLDEGRRGRRGATTGPSGRGRHGRGRREEGPGQEDEACGRAEDGRDGRRDAGPVQLGSVHPLGIFTKG